MQDRMISHGRGQQSFKNDIIFTVSTFICTIVVRYDVYIKQRKPDPADHFCPNWVNSAAESEHCSFPTLLEIEMNDSGDNLIYYSINILIIFVIL